MNNIAIIITILILTVIIFLICSKSSREGYRDPIYLNRRKLAIDWYPRANGSIYGMPWKYGGSWSIMSGYPYYDKAY